MVKSDYLGFVYDPARIFAAALVNHDRAAERGYSHWLSVRERRVATARPEASQ
jgi:hypothetical protein